MFSAKEPDGHLDTYREVLAQTPTVPISTHSPKNHFQLRAALLLFSVLFLIVCDTQLIPPILPFIAEDMSISIGRAGTMVSFYALAAAVFGLILGTASDRFGRKRLLCLTLALFSAASLLTYLVPHFSILLWTRALTGLCAGTLSTLVLAYAADLYPYKHRGKAMGIISIAYFLAFVVGIPIGAIVAGSLGWRWLFLGLATVSALLLLPVKFLLPTDMILTANASPIDIFTHFRVKERLAGISVAFLTSGGLAGFLTFVVAWLHDIKGAGIEQIGLLFMVVGLVAAVASPVSGWLSDLIGKRPVIICANLILAPTFIVVAGLDWGSTLFVGLGLLSVTASARQGPLHALTSQLVSAEIRGSYIATRNAASQLGIASITALCAFTFDSVGFKAVAWIIALVTILIPIICILLRETETLMEVHKKLSFTACLL